MSIVVAPWPPFPLLGQSVRSCRPAVADIPRMLAGNAALYSGHTVGGDLVDGSPSGAPQMGHSRGHDHSGGDGGLPLFRTVSGVALHDGRSMGSAQLSSGGGAKIIPPSQAPSTNGAKTQVANFRPTLWIPPCVHDDTGAYHLLYIRLSCRWEVGVGDTVPEDEIEIYIRNGRLTPGPESPEIMFSSGTVNAFKTFVSSDPIRFLPGTFNPLVFSYRFLTASGGAARSGTLHLVDVSAGII